MTCANALTNILDGTPMKRAGWNGQLQAQIPDAHSKMTTPYLYFNSDEGERVPYTLTHEDIFATDWMSAVDDMQEQTPQG